MQRTCILNDKQVQEFNRKYNTKYTSIMIQQKSNKYYIILDCDTKKRIYRKEALKYFDEV